MVSGDVRRANDVLDDDVLDTAVVQRVEEVAHVQDAQHVVQGVAVDGVARVGRVDYSREGLLRGSSTERATTSGRGTMTS